MNILRTTLITVLVLAASLAALLIPLPISVTPEQPTEATGATISLVDSPPFERANTPSLPEQLNPTESETEETKPPVSTDSSTRVEEQLPPPIEEGIAPIETSAIDEMEQTMEAKAEPVGQLNETEPPREESLDDSVIPDDSLADSSLTEASLASVAASKLSLDPIPSLVDGYYEVATTDQGPIFDRAELASKITYPSLAKRQGREGLVMLRLFISSTGKVERIEVEEDPGYGLAQAAVKAFTNLQGTPAILGGEAVPVTLRYPVRFSLK